MSQLRDFYCEPCDNTFETWAKHGQSVDCLKCGAPVESIISGTSFSLPGSDLGFPTAADKWARRHRAANREHLKEIGQPV